MFVQLDHKHCNSSQQALFGLPSKRQAKEQNMRHNPWGQPRHSITTIPARILRQTARSLLLEQYRWGRYSHTSNRTERRNAAALDLMQIIYLTLGHMWCRLFDSKTRTF